MTHNIKIFTTTKSHWFKEDFPFIKKSLEQSIGRTISTFDVETFSPPTLIPTHRDKEGNVRPSWDWFVDMFTKNAEGYNVVVMHISEYYKKKWNISRHIGGTYRNDPDPIMEFWLCANRGDIAPNYSFSQFARRFIHEVLHGDTYFTDTPKVGDKTTWVHYWDYELNAIHKAPLHISYKRHNMLTKMVELLNKVVKLYGRIIGT